MSFSSIYNAIVTIPRLSQVDVDGKVIKFKAGLNLLVIDSSVDEECLLKIICNGKEAILLNNLSSGTSLMLLIGGVGVVHRSSDDCLIISDMQLLDNRNFAIAIKSLSTSRRQIVAVVRNTRKLPKVKANIIKFEQTSRFVECTHPLAYSSKAL